MIETGTPELHDSTRCLLGEGAFWHPERQQFFWVDILSKRLLTRVDGGLRDWTFRRHVSCMGWVDRDRLVVATRDDLTLLDLGTNARERIVPLEDDKPLNRPNDGRADPQGGFWVSTMGVAKGVGDGALYRFYRGALTKLKGGMTIPNAICFTPDHRHAYFTDTPTQMIMRWRLDADGWPEGKPETWLDLRDTPHHPDGAICDADGNVWSAQWGSGRVVCYGPDARQILTVELPAIQTTCPALGGPDLNLLHVTSAAVGLDEPTIATEDGHGRTFHVQTTARGQKEHRVIL
ncbi:SMP-30/gluconolactonase/LRE family protein [Maribius pontilimi]|uniref:SMP-30/gluconolactonase/LRE family protein n=1 Tax=Palleronia pontilimi TaxID=1964209 RepID=A0A934IGD6_9RHOB|nr:SMP-30/gluconolactonase/LRE family protein [Palleronia pontilimi]MBJ3762403.1 SMP-30/gluconolactonase/LRE family protein [Palleronia pontilimi]